MQKENYSVFDAKGQRKYLTRSEGRAFMKCARKLPKNEALLCLVIFYAGIRISEALALTAGDLDSETSAIQIRCLKKRERLEYRRIPIPDQLSKELGTLAGGTTESRIWNYSRTTAWRIVKQAMRSAGIMGIHATAKSLLKNPLRPARK